MKNNRMKDALENIAHRAVPDDMNLMPHIALQLERKSLMNTLRARPALIVLLVLLSLALLTGVVYAIGKVTGYIPGVGLVDQSVPLRVLKAPIKVKQEELTITVLKVVTDATQTLVVYRVNGIPPRMESFPTCGLSPIIRLPNGTELKVLSDGNSGGMGSENGFPMSYQAQMSYAPVPANIEDIVFVFPCILPIGKGPENWQIQIHLSPVPEGYVLSAVEIGATFVASTPELVTTPTPTIVSIFTPTSDDSSLPATLTPVPNGSGLYLDKVIKLDTSYLLIGNFTDVGDLPGSLLSGSAQQSVPYEFHVTDRNGKPISFSFRPDLMPASDWPTVTYWALEVRKPLDAPITITLPEVSTIRDDSFQFQIDVGTNPVIGQTWALDQTVKVGDYSFMVENFTCVEHGYTLKLRSPLSSEKNFFDLQLEKYAAQKIYERFYDRNGYADFAETLIFKDDPPAGALTFTLHISVDSPIGPWTLTWSPPKVNP